MSARHRAGVTRVEHAVRAEWRVLAAGQLMIIAGGAGLVAAAWTGVTVSRWILTVDGVLLIGYALGVLRRGRPAPVTLARPSNNGDLR